MLNTMDLMEQGIACLVEKLGVVDAEHFISILKRDEFDYTKWQRAYFDQMPTGEFMKRASEYAETHPYTGKASIVL